MERLSHNHTDNYDELLSAYIDNAVDLGERHQAAQLIASCAACAQQVQELRMFRELLRELPNVQPRRSFTLDPATVAPQRRLLFPTLRWSSLVAALLFVVVLGVDVLGGSAPQSAMPASAPVAESAAKGYPQQFDSSGTSGGSADTMMAQGSPEASTPADQGAAESAGGPVPAEEPAASASPAANTVGEAAVPEASAAASPPSVAAPAASPAASEATAASAAASPAASAAPVARNAETAAALSDPAGGAAQQPQMGFRANDPAGADTIQLSQDETAQGSWWSSYGLRIAEVALGLIALVLAGAAIWTWRRQL
ncbi:MAG TPA: hypothetical protein VGD69_32350 [Herpetosiphonaceae bacterium]